MDPFIAFFLGCLTQTQILSHVTKRIVDYFADRLTAPQTADAPLVLNLEVTRDITPVRGTEVASEVDQILLSPMPRSFIVFSPANERIELLVGLLLDGDSPRIAWVPINSDQLIEVEASLLPVGAVFGAISTAPETPSFEFLRVDDIGTLDSVRILQVTAVEWVDQEQSRSIEVPNG